MKTFHTEWSSWICLCLVIAGISSGKVSARSFSQSDDAIEISSSPELEKVSGAGLKFANRLFKILRDLDQENLIYSPFTLHTALAGLKMAADGDTLSEITSATGLNKLSNDFVQTGFMDLIKSLKTDETSIIKMVNRMFTSKDFKVDGNFAKMLRDKFNVNINSIDFSNTTLAAETINEIIAVSTNNTIPEFIPAEDALEPSNKVVLLNSLYFKGEWEREFTPLMTDKQTFYTDNGTEVEVDMMNRGGYYQYGEILELNSSAVSIPYKGNRYSLNIILPERGIPISQLEKNLESFPMQAVLSRMTRRYIQLSVPKFKLESIIDMIGPIQLFGIKTALSPHANLTKMSRKHGLFVNSVIQRAFLSVTEGGTESASSSFVEAVPAAFRSLTPFTVDRPFITFVHDSLTNTVLFVGRKLN